MPEFRIRPAILSDGVEQTAASDSVSKEPSAKEASLPLEIPSISAVQSDVTPDDQPPIIGTKTPGKPSRKLSVFVALTALLVGGVAALGIWKSKSQSKVPQIWDGFLHSKVPVLMCLGAHNVHVSNVVAPSGTDNFSDMVLRRQVIPIDDATVITSMASVLGKKGIPFRIAGAEQTSLKGRTRGAELPSVYLTPNLTGDVNHQL